MPTELPKRTVLANADERCARPRCRRLLEDSAFAPIPISIFTPPTTARIDPDAPLPGVEWVCSPTCAFVYVRGLQPARNHSAKSLEAALALASYQEIYMGIPDSGRRAHPIPPALQKLIAHDQYATLKKAIEIANMAALT